MPVQTTRAENAIIDLADFYSPHIGQMEVHNSKAKVKILEAARRWGKSRAGLGELLYTYVDALDIPASPDLTPPFHSWIVVPTMPQGRQVWNELLSFIPREFVHSFQVEEKLIYLKGSESRPWGLVELKSAYDVESLQTVGLDYLWVNESQDIPDAAFEKLLMTLRSPGRLSKAFFEGIPSLWRDHWFRRIYEAASDREGYESFKFTVYDNPMLTPNDLAEVESDREILRDAAWRRMYLAEFSESAGYFRNVDACVGGDLLDGPIPGKRYVAGLDLGRKLDATVLMVMDAAERRVVYEIAYDAGQSWVMQREGIAHIAKVWDLERILVDATGMGGDIFFQELQEHNVNLESYIFTSASREHLLNQIGISLERQTVSFPKIGPLIRQLRAMQYRKTSGGNYKVEAPPGEHDDYPFALGLGLEACDPAPSVGGGGSMRLRPMRYSPSQSEAEQGGNLNRVGPRMMRERLQKRMEERWERNGVKV